MTSGRRTLSLVLMLALLAVAGSVGWYLWGRPSPLPDGLLQANGRIEGDHYLVASKWPGRVAHILIQEGDTVGTGQVVAELDASQIDAQVRQAEAAVDAAKAQWTAAKTELATLQKQVPLTIDTARADVTHAQAALAAARARADQAQRDAQRMRRLLKKNSVDRERAEQAETALRVAKADVTTALAAVAQAEKRLAEAELGKEQIKAKQAEVEALGAQVTEADARLTEARATRSDLSLRAPAGGVVTERIADEGEVVAAGTPVVDIVDLDRLYLKVYVPERDIGKLRLGLPARIYTDAFPDEAFPATVRFIAPRAEFTPKEVQTTDERVKLVYATKLYLDANPDHRLTPGLPADAVIRWRDGTPWERPRW